MLLDVEMSEEEVEDKAISTAVLSDIIKKKGSKVLSTNRTKQFFWGSTQQHNRTSAGSQNWTKLKYHQVLFLMN